MNIFYLDKDPVIAAQMSADKHCVKMILESAQMLSTAHRFLDGDEIADRVLFQVLSGLALLCIIICGCTYT